MKNPCEECIVLPVCDVPCSSYQKFHKENRPCNNCKYFNIRIEAGVTIEMCKKERVCIEILEFITNEWQITNNRQAEAIYSIFPFRRTY